MRAGKTIRGGAMLILMSVAVAQCFGSDESTLGDSARGEKVYESCAGCHSLDENEIGPKHRNVFGQRAGAVADYQYSSALQHSGILWNEQSLDKWLTNPQLLVPGAKMFFSLKNAQDRADVIEYLKQAGDPKK